MFPKIVQIGPFTVYSYGLMIALGFLLALHLMQRDFRRYGVDSQIIGNIGFWCLLLGILGTRILHIIMFPQDYSLSDPIGWIAIWRGGLVFQGGLPLPFLYAWFAFKKHKVNFWLATDIVMTYIPLGHAFGRMGCFLNGCCFGMRTNCPLGVRFPKGSPAFEDHLHRFSEFSANSDWSFPVHPTQLYGVAGLLMLCAVLILLRKKWNPFLGFVLPVYLMLYSVGRFCVEMLRGDNNPMIGTLTEQQVFSMASFILGVVLFIILRQYRRHHPLEIRS